MNREMETLRNQLAQEALLLREQLIQYYRSKSDPEPEKGLPELLRHISQKLTQNPPDITWLENNIWGIYRVVSDSYLEGTILGNDLYSFDDRTREFIKKMKNNT